MPVRPLFVVAAVGLALAIFAAAYGLPGRLPIGVLALAAVGCAAWSGSPQGVVGVAGLCTVLALVLVVTRPPTAHDTQLVFGGMGLTLAAVWATAVLALQWLQAERGRLQLKKRADDTNRRRSEELEATNRRLQVEVAERQQGEAVRARLVDLLERSPDGVAVLRRDGRLAYLNQAGRELLGLDAGEELTQTQIQQFHPFRLQNVYEQEVLPTAAREGFWRGDFAFVRRDKHEAPVAMTLLSHTNSQGEVEYWAMVAQDLSRQKEAQRALRESEGRLRAIFEAAMDCIITVDQDGQIIEFNRASEKTFRCPRSAAVGREFAALFVPLASRQRYRRNLELYQTSGEGSMLGKRLELEMHRADGQEFMAQIAIQPVALKGQQVFTVFLHDITERKRAEQELAERTEELARSNSDLAQFAYVASHDLLEPLRAVASHCQMLQLKYQGRLDDAADQHIGFAVDGAARMQRLINDLLSYSRVGTQGQPFQPVAVKEMVAEALTNLATAIEESHAQIECDALPTIQGDPRQLPQLFQNLLGNAIKYRTQQPPQIRIRAEPQGRDWRFAVEDNGIGIDPEHSDKIFVIFKRLHGRNQYSGTGIGLAICKKIVERHGGKIWVEPALNGGSVFYFTLPMSTKGDAP